MPIEIGIWKLGDKPERMPVSALKAESRLEETLVLDLSIVSPQLMLIGSQVQTTYGKVIDLLAIAPTGRLTVIELKRDRTPREVVAQLLDYASWVQNLSYDEIATIYSDSHNGKKLEEGFAEAFGSSPPEKLNQEHELLVVATELDSSTERIIGYLSDNFGVPINAVFFRCFSDGGNEYLARSWLIDPDEAEMKTTKSAAQRGGEPWNGKDFYVSLGEAPGRAWEDCRRYGFVSGGGGRWYSQTLNLLFPGARVFVNIPKTGYVAVGTVKESAVPIRDFKVVVDNKSLPLLDAPVSAPRMGEHANDPELSEYVVRVEWIKDYPKSQAFWEKGLFASQHTVCRLRNRFTIEHLTQHFGLDGVD